MMSVRDGHILHTLLRPHAPPAQKRESPFFLNVCLFVLWLGLGSCLVAQVILEFMSLLHRVLGLEMCSVPHLP